MDEIDRDDRFWSKVDIGNANECWEYKEALHPSGYGAYWDPNRGKGIRSHVYAFEDVHRDLEEDEEIRHKCDNRACCNPNHLTCGTRQDNMRDKCRRGRQNSVGTSVFDDEHVIRIRELYWNEGFSQNALAEVFGVSQPCISNIVRGNRYPDLPMPDTDSRPDETISVSDPEVQEIESVAEKIERRKSKHTADNLTPKEVVEIRWRYWATVESGPQIAEDFGIVQSHVSNLANGEKWPYVDGPTSWEEAQEMTLPSNLDIKSNGNSL